MLFRSIMSGTGKTNVMSTASVGYDNSKSVRFAGGNVKLATSKIEEDINKLIISFYLSQSSLTSSGKFIIGVMNDLSDMSTFEPVDTFVLSSAKVPTLLHMYP